MNSQNFANKIQEQCIQAGVEVIMLFAANNQDWHINAFAFTQGFADMDGNDRGRKDFLGRIRKSSLACSGASSQQNVLFLSNSFPRVSRA